MKLFFFVILFIFIDISTQDLSPEKLCLQPSKLTKFWKCALRKLPDSFRMIYLQIGRCVMEEEGFQNKASALRYYICADSTTQSKYSECLINNFEQLVRPTEKEQKEAEKASLLCIQRADFDDD
ncbi:uncharacterized protein [Centruroides vittatus]|uniref:uncharacterized protein n=1 Tax=Centruroides vittatus TaxID=120091 RepID=UPI00350F864C